MSWWAFRINVRQDSGEIRSMLILRTISMFNMANSDAGNTTIFWGVQFFPPELLASIAHLICAGPFMLLAFRPSVPNGCCRCSLWRARPTRLFVGGSGRRGARLTFGWEALPFGESQFNRREQRSVCSGRPAASRWVINYGTRRATCWCFARAAKWVEKITTWSLAFFSPLFSFFLNGFFRCHVSFKVAWFFICFFLFC